MGKVDLEQPAEPVRRTSLLDERNEKAGERYSHGRDERPAQREPNRPFPPDFRHDRSHVRSAPITIIRLPANRGHPLASRGKLLSC